MYINFVSKHDQVWIWQANACTCVFCLCRTMFWSCGLYLTSWCQAFLVLSVSLLPATGSPSSPVEMLRVPHANRKQVWFFTSLGLLIVEPQLSQSEAFQLFMLCTKGITWDWTLFWDHEGFLFFSLWLFQVFDLWSSSLSRFNNVAIFGLNQCVDVLFRCVGNGSAA